MGWNMDMGKKVREGWNQTVFYFKSHIWCSFVAAIIITMILLIIIMGFYTRNKYYMYLVNNTYTVERTLLNSVNRNMESQMENYVDIGSGISVNEKFLQKLLGNLEEEQPVNRNRGLKETLQSEARNYNSIVGMSVADKDGILYQFDKIEKVGTGETIWQEEDTERLQEVFEELKYSSSLNYIPRYRILTYPSIHPNDGKKGIIHIAFPVKSDNSYNDIQYMLLVTFYNSALESFLKQLNEDQESYIQGYIEDENGKILLHTGGRENIGKSSEIYRQKERLQDLSVEIGNYGWMLHAVIDEDTIKIKVDNMYKKAVFLYFMAIAVILMILFWVVNRILRPVNMLSASILNVKKGNMREQIAIQGTNEIWQLAQEYNEMLRVIEKTKQEVEEQHCQVIESMKMKQRAEREALESQINAHFICNTLNAINYEAIACKNYKVSLLLKKLSNILRYTFDQKHQNVYMFQEITWIEQYLFLQKERLEQQFDYEIDFDSDYDNWPCRKLMLQPFVENSILHGFQGRDSGGMIRITGKGYKEYLKIVIEDNGVGMSEERQKVLQEILEDPMLAKEHEVGIGISNVIARMRMYYGKEFQVFLETEEKKGTKFIFILPIPPNGR